MNPRDLKIAQILKQRLSTVVPLVDLRVFGSRARGDEDEYSDMDIFLEVEFLTAEVKERIYHTVWEVGFENNMVISTLVFTREEIEDTPLRASPIVENIMEEGVKI